MKRRMLLWLGLPFTLYAMLVFAVFLLQDRLIFVGAGDRGEELPALRGVRVASLVRSGGERFRVAIGAPESAPRGVLLFFLGNGEDLRSGAFAAREFAEYGIEVWVVEYPGYGDSDGKPSYDSLLEAAAVAAGGAAARATELAVPFIAGGRSLGSFCAVHVAAERPVHRLLLCSPPTTLADAGQAHYPFLPVRLLLRHSFDSLALAPRVRCPALVIHGNVDRIVPMALGRRLADALGGGVQFIAAEGYGHNNLPLLRGGPFGARLRAFLVGD